MRTIMPKVVALFAIAFGATGPDCALAQKAFPHRSITIVAPTGPGSVPDTLPRLLAEKLRAHWSQPVIIENKPGASGNLGADYVFRAAPDGHTLLSTFPGPVAINQHLFAKLSFDPGALAPISIVATAPNVLVIHPNVKVDSLQQLIALAKSNPEKLTYASAGIGTTPHLAMEMLKVAVGINVRHVPYKSLTSAIVDVLGGNVDMVFGNLADVLPHIQGRTLRVLAVGSSERLQELPDIAALAETIPGFRNDTFYAVVAPPGTSPDIVNAISAAIIEAVRDPAIAARMKTLGLTAVGNSPEEAAVFIKRESQRWLEIIKAAKIESQ